MKLLTEYLKHALTFERLAAGEEDPKSSWSVRRRPIEN
jgi:hypothetical protein